MCRSGYAHRRSQIHCMRLNRVSRMPDWWTQGRQVAARWFVGADRPALLTGGSSSLIAHLGLAYDLLSIAVPGDHPEVALQMFVDIVDGSIAVIALMCAEILPVPWTGRHRSRNSTMKGRRNMTQVTTAVRARYRGTLARLASWRRNLGSFLVDGTAAVTDRKYMTKTEAARVTGPRPVPEQLLGSDEQRPRGRRPGRLGTARELAAAAVLGLAVTAGCGPETGELAGLQEQEKTCPPDGTTLASYVAPDVSGSARDAAIEAGRLDAIKGVVTRTAVCGGHLRIEAFSASAAASVVVFDGELKPPGATQIARLLKVDELVAETMPAIETKLKEAVASLPPVGSDILAQFRLAREYHEQLSKDGTPHRLEVHVLTDGMQTAEIDLANTNLTPAMATDLANQQRVESMLPDTVVEIAGIGKVSGDLPSTAHVDALKAFWRTYCGRTGAACTTATDYASGS
jgi:hypothetical protein